MLRIYGIKNCETMKKALAWLSTHGIEHTFIDYKKAAVAAERLPEWSRRAGWRTLLNTRGLTWKRLSEDERAEMDEAKALDLMARHPTLIKRPLLEQGEKILVGFDPERYLKELKG